ncbi:hypothetical protein LTR84_003682 [Exophiala bonariae]|uniref:Nephrocystin 3-like N-terminal domain-containing protein n=1 Tax=Exophiala bonariae TaxID=1690606 RepID=A0AAV9NAH9_9EURO|nr:hypothetical protein LTR84_003682 [Exophiala bonariae]
MDPISAFAVAGNALQFVQLGTNIVVEASTYVRKGGSVEQQKLQDLTQQFFTSTEHLRQHLENDLDQLAGPGYKRALYLANRQCLDLSSDFIKFLDRTKLCGSGNPLQSELVSYRTRLEQVRANLTSSLLVYISVEGGTTSSLSQQINSLVEQLRLSNSIKQSVDQLATDLACVSIDQKNIRTALSDFSVKTDGKLVELSEALEKKLVPLSSTLVTIQDKLTQLQPLLNRDVVARQKAIESLFFEEVNDRRNQIKGAYGDTFQWVLEHNQRDPLLMGAYLDWLEGSVPSNMFWIRGKAGSGKSTLMRYLDDHIGKHVLDKAGLQRGN